MTLLPPLPDRIARQLPPRATRQVVRVDGHDMHVMTQGEGRTVLLLHGNPTWSFLWRKVFTALDGEPFRLVAPDLMGLGLSDRIPAGQHTLANHARWIGGLIDALDLRDLVFVGQDWGGPIGLRALADRPDRVAGLVILNTVIGPPKPGFKATAFHRFARRPVLSELSFRLLNFPQRALHTAQGDRSSIRGDVAHAYTWPLRWPWLNQAPLALARMVPDRLDHATVPDLEVCARFVDGWKGPAAIVWGDKDPILGRVRTHVERCLPQATVTRTTAGHFLQEEVPADIAAAIRDVAARA